jgi:hypothetical protein
MHSILANLHLPRGIGNASAKKARKRRQKKLSYAFLVTVCRFKPTGGGAERRGMQSQLMIK